LNCKKIKKKVRHSFQWAHSYNFFFLPEKFGFSFHSIINSFHNVKILNEVRGREKKKDKKKKIENKGINNKKRGGGVMKVA
jgi:hypothetical protein